MDSTLVEYQHEMSTKGNQVLAADKKVSKEEQRAEGRFTSTCEVIKRFLKKEKSRR